MLKLNKNVILSLLAAACLPGCSTFSSSTEMQEVGAVDGNGTVDNGPYANNSVRVTRQNNGGAQEAPGQATLIWEEPMIDVVDVPPGLDPEGQYYRPAHKSIVEIRQGRWQYYDRRKQK